MAETTLVLDWTCSNMERKLWTPALCLAVLKPQLHFSYDWANGKPWRVTPWELRFLPYFIPSGGLPKCSLLWYPRAPFPLAMGEDEPCFSQITETSGVRRVQLNLTGFLLKTVQGDQVMSGQGCRMRDPVRSQGWEILVT